MKRLMWVIGQKSNIYKIKYMYKSKHTGNTIDEQIEKSLNGENIIENTVDYIDPLESRPISSARIYKAMADEEFIPKNILRIGNNLDDKRQKTYYGLKEYIRTIVPNITTNANDFFNIKKIQSIDDFTTVEISPNIVDLNEENNGFIDAEGCKKYINNLIEDYSKDIENLNEKTSNKVDKEYGKGLSTNDYTNEDHERVWNSVTSIRVNGNEFAEKYSAGLLDIGDVSNLYVADFTISDLYRLDSGEIESLEVNRKALLQALRDHKAIGLLWNNDSPSMSLASVYVDGNMCLTVICDGTMFMAYVNSPDNYDEVEESKSGLIIKEDISIYWIDSYHSYLLDITTDDVWEAYSNNQGLTCDYNALHNAVISRYYISMEAGGGGAVPVNAYIFDEDAIELSYIEGSNWWKIRIHKVEDENGNVYGRVFSREINNLTLYETKNGSRYIITDFTLDTIIGDSRIRVTSELIEAIKHNRPLAIYKEGGGRLYNIEAVEAYINTTTEIYFTIPYEGGIQVEIRSNSIVEEGGSIAVVPTWHYLNDEIRLIQNANGGALAPDDSGVAYVRPGFFADKSVEYNSDNNQTTLVSIRNQITILDKLLMGNGRFSFSPPPLGVAVEYTIKFSVGAKCSWSIVNSGGSSLVGNFFGRTLSDIPAGNYLMKITLCTYVNTKGIEQTEYIAEIMVVSK